MPLFIIVVEEVKAVLQLVGTEEASMVNEEIKALVIVVVVVVPLYQITSSLPS